jgi:hypothetical protein
LLVLGGDGAFVDAGTARAALKAHDTKSTNPATNQRCISRRRVTEYFTLMD